MQTVLYPPMINYLGFLSMCVFTLKSKCIKMEQKHEAEVGQILKYLTGYIKPLHSCIKRV